MSKPTTSPDCVGQQEVPSGSDSEENLIEVEGEDNRKCAESINSPEKTMTLPENNTLSRVSVVSDQIHKNPGIWKRKRLSVDYKGLSPDERQTKWILVQTLSILNKLTPENFDKLCERFLKLELNDRQDRISAVIKVVVEKAIHEPNFSQAYARMVKHVCQHSQETAKNFRKEILDQCQKEFQKTNRDEDEISEKEKKILEAPDEEKKALKAELEDFRTKMRRRSLGNLRFIGELFKLQMLTPKIMVDCVNMLLGNNDEDSLECLCILLGTIGQMLDKSLREQETRVRDARSRGQAVPKFIPDQDYMDKIFKKLKQLSNMTSKLSSRTRLLYLLDLVELRENKWVPRREPNTPKTIEEIRRDAISEEQEEKRQIKELPEINPSHSDEHWRQPQLNSPSQPKKKNDCNTVSSAISSSFGQVKTITIEPPTSSSILAPPVWGTGGGSAISLASLFSSPSKSATVASWVPPSVLRQRQQLQQLQQNQGGQGSRIGGMVPPLGGGNGLNSISIHSSQASDFSIVTLPLSFSSPSKIGTELQSESAQSLQSQPAMCSSTYSGSFDPRPAESLRVLEKLREPEKNPKSMSPGEKERVLQFVLRDPQTILKSLNHHNFEAVSQRLLELDLNNQGNLVDALIKIFFEEVTNKPIYSQIYAKLLNRVGVHQQSPATAAMFKKRILKQCRKGFLQTDQDEAEILQKEKKFSESSEGEKEALRFELKERRSRMRSWRLGNAGFIGELIKLKVIPPKIMTDCVRTLCCNSDEECYNFACQFNTSIGLILEKSINENPKNPVLNPLKRQLPSRQKPETTGEEAFTGPQQLLKLQEPTQTIISPSGDATKVASLQPGSESNEMSRVNRDHGQLFSKNPNLGCSGMAEQTSVHPMETRPNGVLGVKVSSTLSKNPKAAAAASSSPSSKIAARFFGNVPKSNADEVSSESELPGKKSNEKELNTGLKIGERVLWRREETDQSEAGVVKWLGTIQDQLVAGIEFRNPLHLGSGWYDGIQLFPCFRNHGGLIPVADLTRDQGLYDMG